MELLTNEDFSTSTNNVLSSLCSFRRNWNHPRRLGEGYLSAFHRSEIFQIILSYTDWLIFSSAAINHVLSSLKFGNFGALERHGFARNRFWSFDNDPAPLPPANQQSTVDLVLKSTEDDLKIWPHRCVQLISLLVHFDVIFSWLNFLCLLCCSFELRVRISISPGKLTIIPRVRNTDLKAFSFMFSLRNYLYVSDIRYPYVAFPRLFLGSFK